MKTIKYIFLLSEQKYYTSPCYMDAFVMTKKKAIEWCRDGGNFRRDTQSFPKPFNNDEGYCYSNGKDYRTWEKLEILEK